MFVRVRRREKRRSKDGIELIEENKKEEEEESEESVQLLNINIIKKKRNKIKKSFGDACSRTYLSLFVRSSTFWYIRRSTRRQKAAESPAMPRAAFDWCGPAHCTQRSRPPRPL